MNLFVKQYRADGRLTKRGFKAKAPIAAIYKAFRRKRLAAEAAASEGAKR